LINACKTKLKGSEQVIMGIVNSMNEQQGCGQLSGV